MMLLTSLVRFSTQHRRLYCYMILSIWIFLLVTVMYKYIGDTNIYNYKSIYMSGKRTFLSTIINDENTKFKKYLQICTPLENITRKDDGGILDGWKLQGIILVMRHGDRGPLSHVKYISKINCGVENDVLVNRYTSFLINSSNPTVTNHLFWNKIGPFHGFALLPRTKNSCFLGLLSYKGIAQLLHIGDILHQVYFQPLGLHLKSSLSKWNINSTPNSVLNSDEIVVFSTQYHRAFQSAMALLYTFLPQDKWLSLNILQSPNVLFCFSDCTCPRSFVIDTKLNKMDNILVGQHFAVAAVMQWIGQTLLPHAGSISRWLTRDTIMTFICHNATLPCKKIKTPIQTTTAIPTVDQQNDLINIDQDEIPGAGGINSINQQQQNIVNTKEIDDDNISNDGCIEHSHITTYLSYEEWYMNILNKNKEYKKVSLLKAYSLIRHIVSYMLKIISGDKTKFVLYSGHDTTIQYLTRALGIYLESENIPLASRLIFEIYRSDSQTDYYFRVIYNGKDLTKEIDFCEGGKSLRITRDSRGNKADLCPIENIIRFIHDDYFAPLNATNYKDACTVRKTKI